MAADVLRVFPETAATAASAAGAVAATTMATATAMAPTLTQPGTWSPGTCVRLTHAVVVVEEYLTAGGHSQVYLVRMRDTVTAAGGRAVLKRIVCTHPLEVAEARREIEFLAALSGHRHIVPFIDGTLCPRPQPPGASAAAAPLAEALILTAYCPNGHLVDFLNTRLATPLAESEVLHIFSEICQAVAHLHLDLAPDPGGKGDADDASEGRDSRDGGSRNRDGGHATTSARLPRLPRPILHRDLKVENVLIDADGVHQLCDFGSATTWAIPPNTVLDPSARARLQDEIARHSTLQYRAPEMVDLYAGMGISDRTDIWALGVLLYKLCYYTTPFEATGQLAILHGRFTFPDQPPYSPALRRLIQQMLQVRPDLRPAIGPLLHQVSRLQGVACPLPVPDGPAMAAPEVSIAPVTAPVLAPASFHATPNLIDFDLNLERQPQRRGRPTMSTSTSLPMPIPSAMPMAMPMPMIMPMSGLQPPMSALAAHPPLRPLDRHAVRLPAWMPLGSASSASASASASVPVSAAASAAATAASASPPMGWPMGSAIEGADSHRTRRSAPPVPVPVLMPKPAFSATSHGAATPTRADPFMALSQTRLLEMGGGGGVPAERAPATLAALSRRPSHRPADVGDSQFPSPLPTRPCSDGDSVWQRSGMLEAARSTPPPPPAPAPARGGRPTGSRLRPTSVPVVWATGSHPAPKLTPASALMRAPSSSAASQAAYAAKTTALLRHMSPPPVPTSTLLSGSLLRDGQSPYATHPAADGPRNDVASRHDPGVVSGPVHPHDPFNAPPSASPRPHALECRDPRRLRMPSPATAPAPPCALELHAFSAPSGPSGPSGPSVASALSGSSAPSAEAATVTTTPQPWSAGSHVHSLIQQWNAKVAP